MRFELKSEPSAGRPWYAVCTRNQHEATVANALAWKGFEVFLPSYCATRRWRDRTKHLKFPLFPGYVFLQGNMAKRLDILTTPGVCHLVASGGRPAVISESEIQTVRTLVDWGDHVRSHQLLKCGDRVRVMCGPLEGLEGILVREKNSSRLVITIDLVGQSVSAEVHSSSVERLTVRPARRWQSS